jgi:hypothetical protein
LVKASAFPANEDVDIVAEVRDLPRHYVRDFQFSRVGFFRKLDRLMAELDDVSEFIHLETAGRSLHPQDQAKMNSIGPFPRHGKPEPSP